MVRYSELQKLHTGDEIKNYLRFSITSGSNLKSFIPTRIRIIFFETMDDTTSNHNKAPVVLLFW